LKNDKAIIRIQNDIMKGKSISGFSIVLVMRDNRSKNKFKEAR
jgi:hypothetical protein